MNWLMVVRWATEQKAESYRKFDEGLVFYRKAITPGFENYHSYMVILKLEGDNYAFLPGGWQLLEEIPESDKCKPVADLALS